MGFLPAKVLNLDKANITDAILQVVKEKRHHRVHRQAAHEHLAGDPAYQYVQPACC
jgi:hypothetical protein